MPAQAGLNVNLTLQAGNIQQIVQSFQQLAAQMQGLGGQMNINVRQARAGAVGAGGGQQPMNILMQGLSRIIPGGTIMKALGTGGLMAGIATGIIGILGFVKGIFDSSKILGTVTSTFMRLFGHTVDIILMPLIPLIVAVMQWYIRHGFPLARMLGKFTDTALDFFFGEEKDKKPPGGVTIEPIAKIGLGVAGAKIIWDALQTVLKGGGGKPPTVPPTVPSPVPPPPGGRGLGRFIRPAARYVIPALVTMEMIKTGLAARPDRSGSEILTSAARNALVAGLTTAVFTKNPLLAIVAGLAVGLANLRGPNSGPPTSEELQRRGFTSIPRGTVGEMEMRSNEGTPFYYGFGVPTRPGAVVITDYSNKTLIYNINTVLTEPERDKILQEIREEFRLLSYKGISD